jgi:hypothetical protein
MRLFMNALKTLRTVHRTAYDTTTNGSLQQQYQKQYYSPIKIAVPRYECYSRFDQVHIAAERMHYISPRRQRLCVRCLDYYATSCTASKASTGSTRFRDASRQ